MIILTGISGGIGKKIITDLVKIDNIIGLYNSNRHKGYSELTCKYQKAKFDIFIY